VRLELPLAPPTAGVDCPIAASGSVVLLEPLALFRFARHHIEPTRRARAAATLLCKRMGTCMERLRAASADPSSSEDNDGSNRSNS
jgi:hypothetical protein